MKYPKNEHGFSALIVVAIIVVLTALAFGGYYVWSKNKDEDNNPNDNKKNSTSQSSSNKDGSGDEEPDPTKNWTLATTQKGGFSMEVPDGWKMTIYPDDYLGTLDVAYNAGQPATIQTSSTAYMGHSLRFRASISPLDDAGLGPQWASPQPGLSETSQTFSIGALQGKRYKGVFSGDLNQTLYEYIFDLGDNKKLDIVYTIDHDENEPDIVNIVERAIKTIRLN